MRREDPIESRLSILAWDEGAGVPEHVYPAGIRGAISSALAACAGGQTSVRVAHLDEPEQGLDPEALADTDVLVWWGHARHEKVADEAVERLVTRIQRGALGLVVLHSGHYSKIFKRVLGCSGDLQGGWNEDGGPERIRVAAPDHPIARGIIDFSLPREELYAAPFVTPPPECTVLQSYFPKSGKHFPCCLTWTVGLGVDPDFMDKSTREKGQGRGAGRVVYLRPGHETIPSLNDPSMQQLITNAVLWAGKRTD